jgi:hypothetical protein
MTPGWLLDVLAVIMLTVAAVTATRIFARPLLPELPWRPGQAATSVDLANVLMGIAMAGMFTPNLTTLPNVAWEVVFGLLTAWFAYRAWVDARGVRGMAADRCPLHVVHSAAMLYAFLALGTAHPSGGGMGGMGGSAAMPTLSYPTLAGAFVLLLVGYSVWDLNQLSGGRYSLASDGGPAAGAVSAVIVPTGAVASETMASGTMPAGTMPAGAVASGAVASGTGTSGTGTSGRDPAVRTFVLAPQTRVGSDVILGIGMAFMLVIMI